MRMPSEDIYDILVHTGVVKDISAIADNDPPDDKIVALCGKEPSGIADSQVMDCITIYDVGGGSQNPKFAIDSLNLQFRSRTKEYKAGWENLTRIKQTLEGHDAIVINHETGMIGMPTETDDESLDKHTRYIGFWVESPPSFIERDENDRPIFTMHMRIEREPLGKLDGNRQSIAYKGAK